MKKYLLMMALFTLSIAAVNAQDGARQRLTPEERIKATMEKMEPLKLSEEQATKTKAIFTDFYNEQQKAMEEMRASGSMDREAMGAKRKEMSEARDAKLKKVFSEEQFKKWKADIEPPMVPQRRNN